MTALFFGIGAGITVLVRWLEGWDPIWDGSVITTVELTTVPLGFLAGLGGFDYWVRYASGAPTQPEDHSGHGARSWKDYFRINTDHKVIGIQYLVTTIVFFVIAGLLAMFMRAELARPGMQFVDNQTFNGLFSVHAALMIFLFVIPAFAGLGNYVIPLMIGAPDMAFPRLNALSFWLLPIAGVMMVSSFLVPGGAFASGWTGYAPLSVHQPLGAVFFNMGVQWAGASSIMTALNFLVTIITMRAPGMTFWRMPLLVWANFTTSLLVVIATPFIAGSQFFVMFDHVMHTHFFDYTAGGYPLGYQHIFWFYSHPAVYIMMLPGFGIASEVISVMARKPIFGYRLMALSLMAILVLGFSVWAHHMFVSGMSPWLRTPMMVTSLVIAVPTGIKVFSWLATLWEGRIHFTTPMLFALGFVSMFVIGGLSGIYLAAVPIDIHTSDTYFVVAHIHYVLFGGSLFTIFAGIYYWFPKMTGRMYDETARQAPLLAHVHRVQHDLLPDALARDPGHAAPRRRLRAPLRRPEPVHLDLLVRARCLDARLSLQHDQELALRGGRGREPVALADARVAGELAAADLQLRRDPAGRRQPVRVRRAGRAARRLQRRPSFRGGARAMSEERHVLVIANETVAGKSLIDALKRRTEQGPLRVTVITPVNQPREGYVVYEDTRRAAAGRRLERTLEALREAGIHASGLVVEADPVAALRDALAQLEPRPDEIVVSTHPRQKSGWLRRNVVERMERAAEGVPLEHVVVDLDQQGADAEKNVLVIANETIVGEALLEKIRARAAQGPAAFLLISPQSDASASAHPDAERRLRRALTVLRGEGIEAHGQVAHPDPFTAAVQAVQDERIDEIIVSTFPGEKTSSWLRGDLVNRLRKHTSLPVEHVEVALEREPVAR